MVKQERRKYRLTLTEDLLGTVPTVKDLFTAYVATEETGGDEVADVKGDDNGKPGYTTFYSDDKGVYLYDFHIKGFLKEAGNVMKDMVTAKAQPKKLKKGEAAPPPETVDAVQQGVKGLRSKLDNFLFVFPRRIFLKDKVDGVFERPIRILTPTGPRVALAKSDFIAAGLSFVIEIALLPHKELTWDLVENLLDYGQLKGLGQFRNGSYGRFTWERVEG